MKGFRVPVGEQFPKEFAMEVLWQKIDERTGAAVEEEDIKDGGESPSGGGDTGSGGIE